MSQLSQKREFELLSAYLYVESNYFLHIEPQKVITFRIFDVGSKTGFTNNSLKTPKIGKLNIDTLITPQGLLIHEEKNQTKKSHATVPLKGQFNRICDLSFLHQAASPGSLYR